ncbi:MAG TPA: GGDEF domain-containing protein [Xanthobacteraceae bacterium]|jgi:GGDEF domain-containing protein|nr:GGDEF domain-containing protein [Xanthobacteraceae bacterium]
MSLQGPIVVIAEHKDADLVAALATAGAFPIVEASWRDAANAIARIEPAGVVASAPDNPRQAEALRAAVAAGDLYLPLVARTGDGTAPAIAGALPIAHDASHERIIIRLASAQRVRTLHATALRRADTLEPTCEDVPALPTSDPLEDATVIVTGRGRGYPGLTTAVGERVGLIGALSVETAAKYLNARDVDGIVIGEGFNPRTVEALLTVLAEDSRFRDLPIALVPPLPPAIDVSRLPNLERVGGEPVDVVARVLPLVRQHAFEARLQRQLAALDARGLIDPQTGLFTVAAFLRDLNRAVQEAKQRGNDMTLARFTFPATVERRANMDAARLVSRLVRSADFACRAEDGSILLAFSQTALRSAHVVARRIASVLRHTMLVSDGPDGKALRVDPTITLAALKPADTVESLLSRVSEPPSVAAQ